MGGGPFLDGKVLLVRTMEAGTNMVTYDGQPVATGFPSSYHSPDGKVNIEYNGNFNGNVADDDRVQVRSRVGKTGVPAGPDFLFPWGKTPINPGNRPDMNDCPPGTSKNAKEVCRKKEKTFFPSPACLVDVCFGGGIM